ncbi:hypothetical protein [Sodalis praecaptivus]|uniref:hypothetical protein n=1 Tax=Sodalis praecaptivus TaxID=1239307 RepID=UPI0027FEEC8F|nr:hypothetical protein [Sodalis praecaptivus]CAJ0997350.1 hypothetical protein NVIRENTERO_02819 [Sodalis praecaptivus]
MTFGSGCEQYWDQAIWVPVSTLVTEWCKTDAVCQEAKKMAILGACERGEINYCRSDGKTFEDAITELYGRGILLIERASFFSWVSQFNDPSAPVERITARERNNLHAIIGGLLFLLLSDKKTRRNQSGIIIELTQIFDNAEPFSISGLEKKIPLVKDALKGKNFDFDERLKNLEEEDDDEIPF